MTFTSLVTVMTVLGAPSFGGLATDAKVVNNLGRYLESYIGDCDGTNLPGFDKAACEANLAAVQSKLRGELIRVSIDDVSEQLHFAGWDKQKGAFRVHLTPMFPERAVAMTVGKPTRFNGDGLPVLKNIPIWVSLPKGEPEFAFRRRLERGMVRLELLVRPKATWRKAQKGDEVMRGLAVELVALRMLPMRGSDPLAERIFTR